MEKLAQLAQVTFSPAYGAQGNVARKLYSKLNHRAPYYFPQMKFPSVIEIELTNDCNLGCPHCARSIMTRKVGYMDYDLVTRIADQISEHPYTFLRMVGLGESALHPDIKAILSYLKAKKIKSEMVTNGQLLEVMSPEEVVDSGLDFLGISIDGFDTKSYDLRRPGGDYERLKANVMKLWDTRQKMNKKKPMIKIRHVIYPKDSQEDVDTYRNFWFNYADMVGFNKYTPTKKGHFGEPYNRCRHIKYEIKINWNGDVPLCRFQCNIQDEDIIGNLHDKLIKDVWLGTEWSIASPVLKFSRQAITLYGRVRAVSSDTCWKTRGW